MLMNDCTDVKENVFVRTMELDDYTAVKYLHETCLPVRYNEEFYTLIVRGLIKRTQGGPEEKIFTQVAVLPYVIQDGEPRCQSKEGTMAGLITAQTSYVDKAGVDEITFSKSHQHTMVTYILTLCILDDFRRKGIGKSLLAQCLDYASQNQSCGAVYLHVITHNDSAIRFYEKEGFTRVCEVPEYYQIGGVRYNCYLYVLYINGATRAKSLLSITSDFMSIPHRIKKFFTLCKQYIYEGLGYSTPAQGDSAA